MIKTKDFELLLNWIKKILGLDFPPERYLELMQSTSYAARDFKFNDEKDFIYWLNSRSHSNHEIARLAKYFVVGETYFFREKESLQAFTEAIIPQIIKENRGKLTIWSAGCSTGQEPYSIAMIMDRFAEQLSSWQVKIYASDINEESLATARSGIYGNWSFRAMPQLEMERYFTETDNKQYVIDKTLKDSVDFSWLNLADTNFPYPFINAHSIDVIFCRNVLMYIEESLSKNIITKFHYLLKEKGWLLTNPSESMRVNRKIFQVHHMHNTFVYQKIANDSNSISNIDNINTFQQIFKEQNLKDQAADFNRQNLSIATSLLTQPSLTQPSLMPPTPIYTLSTKAISLAPSLKVDKPESVEALIERAQIAANCGELNTARNWCEKALQQEKLNAFYYYFLAIICEALSDNNAAKSALRNVIYLDANFILAYFALGNIARKENRIFDAQRNYDITLSLLQKLAPEEILAHSEGISAGTLKDIITTLYKSF